MAQPIIPGYSIVERIGSGGFASVYLATEDSSGRNVAIKVLHEHTTNPGDLLRFERERTTMRALNGHPNIVAIYDSGTTEDERHFTVLEYVGGGSVRDTITGSGALHWANVVEIGVQICAALDIAHRSGVLHRDVKPANILLEDNTAKLSDFGIARLIGQSQVTAAQSIIGTLAYTPPEVFHNKPFDGRGDIYQLGVSLYEMLLGRAPFTSAAADNKATIIRRILDNPAPPLAQFDVPQQLSDLLDEVLAKDPADRPQTAETFGRRLNEVERALGRTPTYVGEHTQDLERDTATLPPAEHATEAPAVPIVNDTHGEDGTEQAAWPRSFDEQADQTPAAPIVEPPFDANVTVVDVGPTNHDATTILPSDTATPAATVASATAAPAAMSLGTPGPAPAHFESTGTSRATAPTPPAAKRRSRWPWVLLLVGLIGAGAGGVAFARYTDTTTGDSDTDQVSTDQDDTGDTTDDPPERVPRFAALDDAAFLEPAGTSDGVIFDVVGNNFGLTMVGGAGSGESASQQNPVVWTLDRTQIKMQRAFTTGGRFWSIGVIDGVDFLAVGDTAGAGGTDGQALIGDRAGTLEVTNDPSFAGAAQDGLRAAVADPRSASGGFLAGGRRTTNGVATMGHWSVARPSADEPPVWTVIPIDTGVPGAINDIEANKELAVAVGTERIDGTDVGVFMIRRSNGVWSNLIKPFDDAKLHAVTIAGDRLIAVGERSGAPIAIIADANGQGWIHEFKFNGESGVARDVAVVADGRVVAVGDTQVGEFRTGAVWELVPEDDISQDLWRGIASVDMPAETFTELWTLAEFNDQIYVFGRTEVDDRRPAGAWTLTLDG